MANKRAREMEIRNAQKKKRDMQTKTLTLWPLIAAAVTLAAVACMFVNWIEIYNAATGWVNTSNGWTQDPSRAGTAMIEIEAGGWQCFMTAIMNNFTASESTLAPFYYWVEKQAGQPYVTSLAWCAVVAIIAGVCALMVQLVNFFTGKHVLSLVSAALCAVMFVSCMLGFAFALSCSGSMLGGYCNGNPDCAVRSWAIIPALVAASSAAVSLVHFLKYKKVSAEQ